MALFHDDSSHQLENGHPASFRDMDEANEYDFIGVDVAISHNPVGGVVRSALAVLKPDQFPSSLPHLG